MTEMHSPTEIVKVVPQSADTVIHRTANHQSRREDALTALNSSCSTDELESLARVAAYADIDTIEQEAVKRWGTV